MPAKGTGGRPASSNPLAVVVPVRLTATQAALLDRLRGSSSRSAFLRRLIIDKSQKG